MPDRPSTSRARYGLSTAAIRQFLDDDLSAKGLRIGAFLPQLDADRPFFFVAATGLGKTVGVPLHVLAQRLPSGGSQRVWVIVPTVKIATDTQRIRERLWKEWWRKTGQPGPRPPLYGCITRPKSTGRDAPIMFVSTGIFALLARGGELRADRDTVIFDEAHRTLGTDEAVELGLVLARQSGVKVHFMSATVDTTGLESALGVDVIRADTPPFPIWKHNVRRPLHEALLEVVETVLVKIDTNSALFPPEDGGNGARVRQAVLERNRPKRAKGFLVVVTSHQGARSDVRRALDILEPLRRRGIEIVALSRKVMQDDHLREEYERAEQKWQAAGQKYVVVATSVVEMGVTLPDLDFVFTMDTGFSDVEVDGEFLKANVDLGVNALLQRIGRVGRVRPGLAFISRESESTAPYSDLDDGDLNRREALAPEPIELAMRTSPLTALAYHSFAAGWSDSAFRNNIAAMQLPSGIHRQEPRMNQLARERARLRANDLADEDCLTDLGTAAERWVGRFDLSYVSRMLEAASQGDHHAVAHWLLLTIAAEQTIVDLLAPGRRLGQALELAPPCDGRDVGSWTLRGLRIPACGASDVVTVANILLYFIRREPTEELPGHLRDEWEDAFAHDCRRLGLGTRRVETSIERAREALRILRDMVRDDVSDMLRAVARAAEERGMGFLCVEPIEGVRSNQYALAIGALADRRVIRFATSSVAPGILGWVADTMPGDAWTETPSGKIPGGATMIDWQACGATGRVRRVMGRTGVEWRLYEVQASPTPTGPIRAPASTPASASKPPALRLQSRAEVGQPALRSHVSPDGSGLEKIPDSTPPAPPLVALRPSVPEPQPLHPLKADADALSCAPKSVRPASPDARRTLRRTANAKPSSTLGAILGLALVGAVLHGLFGGTTRRSAPPSAPHGPATPTAADAARMPATTLPGTGPAILLGLLLVCALAGSLAKQREGSKNTASSAAMTQPSLDSVPSGVMSIPSACVALARAAATEFPECAELIAYATNGSCAPARFARHVPGPEEILGYCASLQYEKTRKSSGVGHAP